MLVLTVRPNDYLVIGQDIVVKVLKTKDDFKLSIDAPKDVKIERGKVFERKNARPEPLLRVERKG